MNEKIKTIAEFDGWDKPITNYLTDLNALHRVALDVMDRTDMAYTQQCAIVDALTERPINGQYTDLVDAVYDAIVYLKKHNQCQPK